MHGVIWTLAWILRFALLILTIYFLFGAGDSQEGALIFGTVLLVLSIQPVIRWFDRLFGTEHRVSSDANEVRELVNSERWQIVSKPGSELFYLRRRRRDARSTTSLEPKTIVLTVTAVTLLCTGVVWAVVVGPSVFPGLAAPPTPTNAPPRPTEVPRPAIAPAATRAPAAPPPTAAPAAVIDVEATRIAARSTTEAMSAAGSLADAIDRRLETLTDELMRETYRTKVENATNT